MENRELENKISSVICGMVPEDSFDKITDRIAKGDVPERSNVKMSNGSKVKRVLFPVAAACIFLIVQVYQIIKKENRVRFGPYIFLYI